MSTLRLPRLPSAADAAFPPTRSALRRPNGLLAWGGDLSPQRLLNAYRSGIFPWYSNGEPILWWTPDPRCVIRPQAVHVSRRTRRRYNTGRFRVTADTEFEAVINGCAAPRAADAGTWITEDLQRAFVRLHALGHAHSVEVWQDGELAGGLYGLALGRAFFGESMFSRATDASKIALTALCRQLEAWSFAVMDCQVTNPHLLSLGAEEWPRSEFESTIAAAIAEPGLEGSWEGLFQAGARW